MSVVTGAQGLPANAGQGRRVLFVNADADLREAVTRVLGSENFEVQAVVHSGHALLLCRTQPFDVAILELAGPDISGPALMEQLRRHQQSLLAIYLGSPGSPEGVEHLLVRPFTSDDLIEHLELALSGVAA